MTNLIDLTPPARELIAAAKQQGLKIATAESCTGGLIIGVLTEIAGSSAVVDRGFVTYSNAAKIQMLGVSAELIANFGAVSEEVAIAMVEGAIAASEADLAVAVTGVAGPGGGSPEKPVGLVHLAAMRRGQPAQGAERRYGDIGRSPIRLATVGEALAMMNSLI
jgi:nicotinamide-nucleotide amidase